MKFTKKYFSDKQFLGTIYVTFASLLGGFFSYVLQIFLGRTFSLEDYGTFNAFLSLFSIIVVLTQGLGVSMIKVSSELFGKHKLSELSALFWYFLRAFFIAGLFGLLFFGIFKNTLSVSLNISDANSFVIFGFYILCSVLMIPPQSYLQGLLEFKGFSIFAVVRSLFRLITAGLLAYLGYSVGAVYLGMGLIQIPLLVFSVVLLKKYFVRGTTENLKKNAKRVITFSLPVFLVFFGLAFFNNIDIILVKKFFDAETSGYYVGTATIGKMILFGIGSISLVMFPQISAMHSKGENYSGKLRMFTLVQVSLAAIALLVYALFPKLLTLLFFGDRFLGSVESLPLYALFITLYVLVSYFVRFFLAVNKTFVAFLLIPIAFFQLFLLSIFHGSIDQVLWINTMSMVMLLIGLFAFRRKLVK